MHTRPHLRLRGGAAAPARVPRRGRGGAAARGAARPGWCSARTPGAARGAGRGAGRRAGGGSGDAQGEAAHVRRRTVSMKIMKIIDASIICTRREPVGGENDGTNWLSNFRQISRKW